MFKSRAVWFLSPAFAVGALLAFALGSHRHTRAEDEAPLDDWDIPQLVDRLNKAGLGLRVVSVQKDGSLTRTVFLTNTDQKWSELNHLYKSRQTIHRWQGTLYCELGPGGSAWTELSRAWGDHVLIIGPFLFYGDPELLAQVGAVLEKAPFRH